MRRRISCNHPTLNKLRRLDSEAARRFPAPFPRDPGLGALGLIMWRGLQHRYYPCTPLNCWTFAHTGGDGVHFSLLALDGSIREDSPVVITIPSAFPCMNLIGGENLFDFLCFGMYRGYFCLGDLECNAKLTLRACTDPSWQPSEDRDYAMGFGVDEHHGRLLALLIERFGLQPWPGPERFEELQEKYKEKMVLPPGFPFFAE